MESRVLRSAVIVFGLLAVAACGREAASPRAAGPGRPPGIVMIVVDTLRADAVPLDDHLPTLLPSARTFAKGATAFSDAVASAAWTPQSMPSVLTGLSPPHTGCEGMMSETRMPPLAGGVSTLAERLKAAGYLTAAYTGGGYLAACHGLAQGFDTFAPSFDVLGPEACLTAWSKQRPSGPFFLLLHTYAAHDPYGDKDPRALASAAPAAVAASVTLARTFGPGAPEPSFPLDPAVMRECAFEWLCDGPARPANCRLFEEGPGKAFLPALHRWLDGGYLSDATGRAAIEGRLRAAYQRGLVPTEAVLARTFAALEAARLPSDTIVILTSDHGEALGEHGYLTHERRLHDEIVRVPLLVRAPGRMPAGKVVRGACGPVDLTPTLLELVGLPLPAVELDGRSLVALAHGRAGGHPVVSTADRFETVNGRPRAVRELTVRDERRIWCYVYDVETGDPVDEHVFDLDEDPRSLEPRPAGTVEWHDAEFCRLVAASRDEARQRYALPPIGVPCEPVR